MSELQFDLYFSGQILAEQDPEAVKARVGQLFRVSGDALEKLFSGKPVRIKQGVDADTARRYEESFHKAGTMIESRLCAETPVTDAAEEPSAGEQERPVAAPPQAQSASQSSLSLAPVGADMDDTPPTPPLEVDTSALSAGPPNSGSLEDCVSNTPPAPIPDISRLSLDDT